MLYCEDHLSDAEGKYQAESRGSAALFMNAVRCTFLLQGNYSKPVSHLGDCSSSAEPQISLWSEAFYRSGGGSGVVIPV